jgi:hypothetical protein
MKAPRRCFHFAHDASYPGQEVLLLLKFDTGCPRIERYGVLFIKIIAIFHV